MVDLFNYFRRETTEVNIGAVPLGGPNSIRVQSMTNTSTQDTQACVEQRNVLLMQVASMSASQRRVSRKRRI